MATAGRVVTMGLTFQNVNKILDLCAHNIPTCTMYTHTQLLWTSWLTWHVRLVDTMYVAGLYEPSLSDGIFYEATYQMQLPILIRVEFEGTMLLETSKDFNAESLNRPIVTPRGAKNDVGHFGHETGKLGAMVGGEPCNRCCLCSERVGQRAIKCV